VPGDPASRIFFGGGGGAGHANDDAIGPGGRGGGIVFLLTRSISGAGTISADGADGGSTTGANRDGASGAGGGGSIVIRAAGRVDDADVHANGGRGGDQLASVAFPDDAYGPGGGGGGGLVAISSPVINVAPAAGGGASGTSGTLDNVRGSGGWDLAVSGGANVTIANGIALASGVTAENVGDYLPYVDAFLVGTGIEARLGVLDPARLRDLLDAVATYRV